MFCLLVCLAFFFLVAWCNISGKQNYYKWDFSNVVVSCERRESIIFICWFLFQSFMKPIALNFKNVSQVFIFYLLCWDKMAKDDWSWEFPFPQISWALIINQQFRLWLISLSWGQALLRRTVLCGTSEGFLSHYLPEAQMDFSLLLTVGNLSSSWRWISGYYGSPYLSGVYNPVHMNFVNYSLGILSTHWFS